MNFEQIKSAYLQYLLSVKNIEIMCEMKRNPPPAMPPFFKDQSEHDEYNCALLNNTLEIQAFNKELTALNDKAIKDKEELLRLMDAHVWIPSGHKPNEWLAKQCSDWPMDKPSLLVEVNDNPATLRKLRLQIIKD